MSASGTRRIIRTRTAAFGPYEFDDYPQPGIEFMPLSYDMETGKGSYMMRMAPGTRTQAHTHTMWEEYLILEGDLVEDDGTRLGPGDYVVFGPGTRHDSRTESGCLLIAFDWQR